MITRPFDLVSKLRPRPRNFDALLFVSVGLVGLQFALFGSDFVLRPGLPVDFASAEILLGSATQASARIIVTRTGLIFTIDGPLTREEFRSWLKREIAGKREPHLLIVPDADVPQGLMGEIIWTAQEAGFKPVIGFNAPSGNAKP